MTGSAVVLAGIGCLAAGLVLATLLVVVRGGRGPGDPPASHPRTDPAGFWTTPPPQPPWTAGPPRRRIGRDGPGTARRP